jgi:hypothetical protein
MSKIEFVSHESFPEDEYTKEIVYICLEGKYRVAYVRKASKNGGLFWSVASIGATKNGVKEFFPAFLQDSNFLEKDIKDFLDRRSWVNAAPSVYSQKQEQNQIADQLPF